MKSVFALIFSAALLSCSCSKPESSNNSALVSSAEAESRRPYPVAADAKIFDPLTGNKNIHLIWGASAGRWTLNGKEIEKGKLAQAIHRAAISAAEKPKDEFLKIEDLYITADSSLRLKEFFPLWWQLRVMQYPNVWFSAYPPEKAEPRADYVTPFYLHCALEDQIEFIQKTAGQPFESAITLDTVRASAFKIIYDNPEYELPPPPARMPMLTCMTKTALEPASGIKVIHFNEPALQETESLDSKLPLPGTRQERGPLAVVILGENVTLGSLFRFQNHIRKKGVKRWMYLMPQDVAWLKNLGVKGLETD